MQANMTDDPFESFTEVSYETLLTLFFIAMMLALNKTLYAFIQVTTAILFCENIVAFSIVPILVWLTITDDLLSYYALGLLLFWNFTLVTYVFKKVLSINTAASAVLALFYFTATYFGAFALGQM
ncbi:MAG: hypothetical protein ACXWTS_03400 [Methylococcaceae bacterium]